MRDAGSKRAGIWVTGGAPMRSFYAVIALTCLQFLLDRGSLF